MLKLKRFFYLFIILAVVGVLVTSCEREIIIEEDIDGVKIDENNVEIEYATLEEINQAFIGNGLEPLDISNSEIESRTICDIGPFLNNCQCNRWAVSSRGDINNDRRFSITDLILADRVRRGLDPPNQFSWRAGGIETLNGNGNICSSSGGTISAQDIDIMCFALLSCNC